MEGSPDIATLLHALHVAAGKHRDQRRKGAEASPYINHPIEVAELLARVGGVTDLVTLQAAILHDTLEDTQTTPKELEAAFGPAVRQVVEEITDNKQLPKAERKRLQVEHAPHLSTRAKLVKLADKISNIGSIIETPPTEWSLERKQEYFTWSERVVAGCRGSNAALERAYDEIVAEGRRVLGASQSSSLASPSVRKETIDEKADQVSKMILENLRDPANHPDYHECDWLRTQHAKSKR